EEKTKIIFWKLIEEKKILAVEDDKKLKLVFEFWKLWKEISREYKEEKLKEIYEKWKEFFHNNNVQDAKYIFEKIILNLSPNWNYIYKNLSFTGEEELKGFLKKLLEHIFSQREEDLGGKIMNFKANL
ncbi:MAG: hypothetical protein ACK4SU_02760, partial [Dictyoglomus sp.]